MKQLFTTVLLCCCMTVVAPLYAQTPPMQAAQATVAAGADGNHLCVSIGQPFFQQNTLGDYEFSMGVAQAQWVRDTVYDVISYNTPYTENGFDLPTQTGTHKDRAYLVNSGIYNYDLIRTLFLIVCPEKVTDAFSSAIQYDALAVSGHCWTKQNLRSPVQGAMSYERKFLPAVPEVYGLLYTWNTAVNGTTADADGYLQGICPNTKWHIPDAEEMNDLLTHPAEALRSTDGWVSYVTNTNSTGFTAYPAGFYNSALSRFEGLSTQTDWWTTINAGLSGGGTLLKTSLELPCHCDMLEFISRTPDDAVSVRCVMKNEWPE